MENTGQDGPLLLAFLLTNNNNNPSNVPPDTYDSGASPGGDILAIRPQDVMFELTKEGAANLLGRRPKAFGSDHNKISDIGKPLAQDGEDGPILLALLLNNNNNNNNAANVPSPGGDILAIRPQDVMFELTQAGAVDLLDYKHRTLYGDYNNLSGHTKPQKSISKPDMQRLSTPRISNQPNYDLETIPGKIRPPSLTEEQLEFWSRQGYLVLQDMLGNDQLAQMVEDVHKIADNLLKDKVNVRTHPVIHGKKLDFEANGRVMALLTENAFDASLEPLQRIQRLGTGIHRVLPNFRSATFSNVNQEIARCLGFSDPRVTQSLIVTKAAANGAKVIPHQDGCSSFTDPPSCVTFWYALEDSKIENGCLKVIPGSHRTHPIARRCCKDETGRPQFRNLDVPIYIESTEPTSKTDPQEVGGNEEFRNLEVKASTLILMHGNLMHASEPNHSSKSRIAFNFGVVEGGLKWLPDNYLQPYDGETEFEKLAPLS